MSLATEGENMSRSLDLIKQVDIFCQKAGGAVVLEAAHFYVQDGIDESVLSGAKVALDLIELMAGFNGVNPVKMLFIDDVVNKKEEMDGKVSFGQIMHSTIVPGAIEILSNLGYPPDKVVMESDLIDQGNRNIQYLLAKGLAKPHNGLAMLKSGWIRLQGKAGDQSIPSCETLDATLYAQKLGSFGGAITVLPHGYQAQQGKTRSVLHAISGIQKPNVLVVYHNKKAEISDLEYWG